MYIKEQTKVIRGIRTVYDSGKSKQVVILTADSMHPENATWADDATNVEKLQYQDWLTSRKATDDSRRARSWAELTTTFLAHISEHTSALSDEELSDLLSSLQKNGRVIKAAARKRGIDKAA